MRQDDRTVSFQTGGIGAAVREACVHRRDRVEVGALGPTQSSGDAAHAEKPRLEIVGLNADVGQFQVEPDVERVGAVGQPTERK